MHVDGSWVGSGLDSSGRLARNLWQGRRQSRLSLLLYLDPLTSYEGGETTFQTAAGLCAVRMQQGSALCFFHGEHPLSPWHEGSPVTRGVKHVIRTDVLYCASARERGEEVMPNELATDVDTDSEGWALLGLGDLTLEDAQPARDNSPLVEDAQRERDTSPLAETLCGPDHLSEGAAQPAQDALPLVQAAPARAYLHCLDPRAAPCAWDEFGRRVDRTPVQPALDSDAERRYAYGAPAGSAAHELLSADEFESRLRFELVDGIVAESRHLLRQLPLYLLPREAVEACLPAEADEAAIATLLRSPDATRGAVVFVAPVSGMGHGLFAAADLQALVCLGEYSGVLCEDSFANAKAPDEYLMAYPARGLHISAASMGGLLRFANHAPRGEANLDVFPVLLDGAWHMVGLTLVPISAATQITLDYGNAFWDGQHRTPLAT